MRLLLLFLVLLAGACGRTQDVVQAPEAAGEHRSNLVELPSGPYDRIVSLTPNMTEMVAALGAGVRLVGRTPFCTYPPEIADVPVVSGGVEPDVEALLRLAPNLIVAQKGIEARLPLPELRRAGIQVYYSKVETADDVMRTLRELGQLTGQTQQAAELASGIKAQLEQVRVAAGSTGGMRVLMIHGHRPLIGAGPGSWGDELIRLAGYRNALGEGVAPYATLDAEWVVQLGAQVLVDTSAAYEEGDPDVFWSFLTRQGSSAPKLVYWGDELVLRPGPRVGDAVNMLRTRIEAIRQQGREP